MADLYQLELLLKPPLLFMRLRFLGSLVLEEHHKLLDVIAQQLNLWQNGESYRAKMSENL